MQNYQIPYDINKTAILFLLGVVIDFVELLKDLYPKTTEVRVVAKNIDVLTTSMNFDKKLSVMDAVFTVVVCMGFCPLYLTLLPNEYRNLLHNLINELKANTNRHLSS